MSLTEVNNIMRKIICLGALFVVGITILYAQQSKLPSPREPKRPEVTSVDQLLPNARIIVAREREIADGIIGIGLKKGERALIFADSSWDPLVVEAISIAIKEAGGSLDLIVRGGFPDGKGERWQVDPAELMRTGFGGGMRSKWITDALRDYDVVVGFWGGTTTVGGEARVGRIGRTRLVRWEYPTARQLAGADIAYPEEILKAISHKIWEQVKKAKEVRITDPLGTDITFHLDERYWSEVAQRWGKAWYGETELKNPIPHEVHITLFPTLTAKPDARGVIVARALHSGPIPEIKLYFDNGHVTRVEGGGKAGEYIREALEKYKDIQAPGLPGPGPGWLEEVSLGTNPKAARPYSFAEYERMGRYPSWSHGRRRSGVIHMAIGWSFHFDRGKPQPELPSNHRDFEIYFPTYYLDGVKIVDNGHLLALDDPEIRKIAAKYGDPDVLLREDWIPELGK